jgi:pimeloyl-ACP methyl ester carboxylesterase
VTAATDIRVPGDGISLAATAYGSALDPAVVLLHGGGQTRHAWGTAGDVLAAGGRYAVSVDLRGHGDSDWAPDGDYGMTAFARDTAAVAASLSPAPSGPPVLVGASLGGLASLTAIGEGFAVASALVLVDVTPRVEFEGAMRIRDFMAGGMHGFASLEEAADAIAEYLPHRPRPTDLSGLTKNLRQGTDGRYRWHWDPALFQGHLTPASAQDPERRVLAARGLDVPTLLVRGRMSDLLSEEAAAEFLELVPHAEFVDVRDAGHMVAGDRNDVFTDAVAGFLIRHLHAGDRAGGVA